MVRNIFEKSRKIFDSQQNSILSAATIIMLMIVASRVLGLVRQRILAHFFSASDLSLFFAAFRLPDTVFEVLVFGTFSSAFIPVFAKLAKNDEKDAWKLAGYITNIGLIIFTILALGAGLLSGTLYKVIAPGYAPSDQLVIVRLTKILFVAQGFFVVSYVLTGVLESLKRFLVPALAPLFYNLGIIFGTIFLSGKLGLMAPVVGVFIGAFSHFIIQLPLALKLGFRFIPRLELNEGVRKIGKLALPRVIEVCFLQISKTIELFFASLISTASYTYYTFGNTLQLLPVGIFGTSIAKAALPTLSGLSDSKEDFSKALFKALFEMTFLVIPLAAFLMVLRIPVVRLVYGTDIFTWKSTIETGWVLSAFSVSIVFQAANALLARGFYALHDTKTPVLTSIFSIIFIITMDFVFINIFHTPVWGLAAAFSIGSFLQSLALFILMNRRLNGGFGIAVLVPFFKHVSSSFAAGLVMYVLLKFFDKSVWVKRLSFLGKIEATRDIAFEKFVLDTRYTVNLVILTALVALIGIFLYLFFSFLLKTKELRTFYNLFKRLIFGQGLGASLIKEKEPITPLTSDTDI